MISLFVMNPTLVCRGSESILFDADSGVNIESRWFDPDFHRQQGRLDFIVQGRGQTCFVSFNDDRYVLRHYRRGGKIASWLDDRYIWSGLENTRAFREWRLLVKLVEQRLPVPYPFAARVVRNGFFYRADLVTREICNAHTLAQLLMRSPLSFEQWRKIGRIIRRFHEAGVFHADLNAHNILIDPVGEVYLIDFDKGAMRESSQQWKNNNLLRLHRSLLKVKRLNPEFKYENSAFQVLVAAYWERV